MQARYTQLLTALRQAQKFLDGNDATLAPVNATGARKSFDAIATKIAEMGESQGTHRMQTTGERRRELKLAEQLRRKHLRPIVRIARARLATSPELAELALPPFKTPSAALARNAKSMRDLVEPKKQLFIDAGLAPDFLDQLTTAADAVVEAIGSKGSSRGSRMKATDTIAKETVNANRELQILDSMVRAHLELEEPLITEWRDACRVIRRASRGVKQPSGVATASATPAPAEPTEVKAA
jgi:hypothetical protein